MVLNATFNNVSDISWPSVLFVEETGVPGENHQPTASHWQSLLQNVSHLFFLISVSIYTILFYSIICIYFLCSVLWCPLRFRKRTMFGSPFPPVFLGGFMSYLSYLCLLAHSRVQHVFNIWVTWRCLIRDRNCLPLASTWVHRRFLWVRVAHLF